MTLFSIAFSLFLLMDSFGNIPFYISLLKELEPRRQRIVIVREMLIALAVIILFTFLGEGLMHFLNIEDDTIQIAGGIILFLLCLKMIFPASYTPVHIPHKPAAEPFIVPLAIPLVAGPGVLASVMIYTKQETNEWLMIQAIMLAWGASLIVLLTSSLLKNILGEKGITAIERLMGLVLTLIAVQMFLSGISTFVFKIVHSSP
jgi:multiple antibiotic resistance protein